MRDDIGLLATSRDLDRSLVQGGHEVSDIGWFATLVQDVNRPLRVEQFSVGDGVRRRVSAGPVGSCISRGLSRERLELVVAPAPQLSKLDQEPFLSLGFGQPILCRRHLVRTGLRLNAGLRYRMLQLLL